MYILLAHDNTALRKYSLLQATCIFLYLSGAKRPHKLSAAQLTSGNGNTNPCPHFADKEIQPTLNVSQAATVAYCLLEVA